MKKDIYLILTLLLLLSLIGCNTKSSTPVSQTQNKADTQSAAKNSAQTQSKVDTQSATTVDYQSVARDFLNEKNLKIAVNSVGAEDIQLPSDFKAVKHSVNVGDLLKQRNELSKQNNLEFSKYMGQKVKMYTAQIETGDLKSNYDVVLFIAENKVVAYWIDAGIKDPKQNRPDFNVLVNLLIAR